MLDPRQLFEVETPLPEVRDMVLVEGLDGFIDAGGAKRIAAAALLERDSRIVARFDVDQLFDYRARRPAMLFVDDHWESYADPELALHLVTDAVGSPFLVLAGPEPDVQWERFSAAVRLLVEQFGVRLTVGMGAIPMAVPHTRPLGVIVHGSRPELVAGQEPWVNTVQVPASAGHLLEYRLGTAGHDALGFAVHVPHYLAQTDYPAAAARLLESVAEASGLVLPTPALQEQARETGAAIDAHVAEAPEVAEVVRALEGQYDLFISRRGQDLLADGTTPLPTADELGAELERFLAQQTPRGDADN